MLIGLLTTHLQVHNDCSGPILNSESPKGSNLEKGPVTAFHSNAWYVLVYQSSSTQHILLDIDITVASIVYGLVINSKASSLQ